MSLKNLLINAALAGLWVAVGVVLEDPRYVALAPVARAVIGYIASKLGHPVPVDTQ